MNYQLNMLNPYRFNYDRRQNNYIALKIKTNQQKITITKYLLGLWLYSRLGWSLFDDNLLTDSVDITELFCLFFRTSPLLKVNRSNGCFQGDPTLLSNSYVY